MDEETLTEVRRLQWKVCTAEEWIGQNGVVGIRTAITKELGFGSLSGGRLPLKGTLAASAYDAANEAFAGMIEEEKKL
jgi:2-keto-3-deoxy-L-rhamnonate aldolase